MSAEAVRSSAPDIREVGAPIQGVPQHSDRRLYMVLQAFGSCRDPQPCIEALAKSGLDAALYLDATDPQGIAVVVASTDADVFTGAARAVFNGDAFAPLVRKPELTMIGRTYSTGRETNLDHWLIERPRSNLLNPQWPWVVWYPLRRKAGWSLLPTDDQRRMLGEHAAIGASFGQADYAHDVRLASYGLDRDDNEFVIGLLGKDPYPLSRCVQEMRKTHQTAEWIQKLGPFFVGKAAWQTPAK